ncbi:MAG: phospholipase D-like domain-containing protein, partial [Candidatus Thermoplasmatota archaeon]|nr:phospholipase D-like domain-containing protein [Candidatus Thermoplasmatota archaeon]
RFVAPELEMGSRNQRYRFNHAKYAIADGETLVLGTENWKPSGLPERGKEGNRGWGVVLKSHSLCESIGQVFQSDWEGVLDSVPFGTPPYIAPPPWFSPQEEKWFSRTVVHDERVANGWFQAALLVGPENNLMEEGVLAAINSAENRILLQLMDLKIEWRIFGQEVSNPYVEAILEAARRGVEVNILLDSRYVVDDGETIDNSHALRWLNDMAMDEELPMEVRLADLREMDVDKVHTKGMIVDGSTVLVSSLNWNSNSMLRNREMGLLMYSQEAGEYFEQVFMWDWDASGDGGGLASGVEKDEQSSFLFPAVAAGTLAAIGVCLWIFRRR